ncbi:putative hemin transport protein [Rhodobacter aestuarii]|uniref:Putative hemin transport protein n=1 Tax=Rhodobacter aestuarii TaxID=453582 RepID=A0A1N7LKA7_9RHOB|nr:MULTISPECIES: ChuX/HutX family heme-like substrate-binding protein [Rhodobacter]PTV95200.1 putative hemin transport protein [Rhodobacter aestuarii]SIS74270.1 putative hemin transport protein [Rhodobacter aestuarii]SOC07816.1 putative hemin transport protein [Rhodobacter sp. JA431]
MPALTADQIRTARAKKPRVFARDFAEGLGITEAELCAAFLGSHATRIIADPSVVLPRVTALGEVMALTRNDSCVLEKVGQYDNFAYTPEGAQVVNGTIELQLDPARWIHAFAWDEPTNKGPKRSIQIYDASGEAVHKVHLREASDAEAWAKLVADLALPDQSDALNLAPKAAARAAEPHGVQLAGGAVEKLMYRAGELGLSVRFTVESNGCMETHRGSIHRVLPAGPWINVLDPGLELHLRMDHMAAVWRDRETVEAFDAEGRLIVQMGAGDEDAAETWRAMLDDLPTA